VCFFLFQEKNGKAERVFEKIASHKTDTKYEESFREEKPPAVTFF